MNVALSTCLHFILFAWSSCFSYCRAVVAIESCRYNMAITHLSLSLSLSPPELHPVIWAERERERDLPTRCLCSQPQLHEQEPAGQWREERRTPRNKAGLLTHLPHPHAGEQVNTWPFYRTLAASWSCCAPGAQAAAAEQDLLPLCCSAVVYSHSCAPQLLSPPPFPRNRRFHFFFSCFGLNGMNDKNKGGWCP